jgi:hypothetical protein
MAGFQATGISHFNPNIFTKVDFLPAFVTDRQLQGSVLLSEETRASQETANTPCNQSTTTFSKTQSKSTSKTDMSNAVKRTAVANHGSQISATIHTSPEDICPFPKAGPRKQTYAGRRKRKTAVLTDTPVKRALEEEKKGKKAKGTKRRLMSSASSKQTCKKRTDTAHKDDTDEEQEWFCLVCTEPYSNSRPGENWVQCTECKGWAHTECTSNGSTTFVYVCQNCDSDDDM